MPLAAFPRPSVIARLGFATRHRRTCFCVWAVGIAVVCASDLFLLASIQVTVLLLLPVHIQLIGLCMGFHCHVGCCQTGWGQWLWQLCSSSLSAVVAQVCYITLPSAPRRCATRMSEVCACQVLCQHSGSHATVIATWAPGYWCHPACALHWLGFDKQGNAGSTISWHRG